MQCRGCLQDIGATFEPARVHSDSLSWLYICLHYTATKCHPGASHTGVSSPRLLYWRENFTPVRNFVTVSCKRETTTRFRSAGGLERLAHAQFSSIQDGVHVGHGITEVKQISVKGKGRRRHRKLHRLSGFAFLQYLSRLFNL